MKNFFLIISLIIISLGVKAQSFVSPTVNDVPSSITRSSFYIEVLDPNLGEDSVQIEFVGGGVTRYLLIPGGLNVYNQQLTGLLPSTTYAVRARVKGACMGPPPSLVKPNVVAAAAPLCDGPWSAIKYITTLIDLPPRPILASTNNCPTFVGLHWEVPTRANEVTEYIVQRSFDNSNWETIANLPNSYRDHFDTDARNGRTMFYRVVSVNSSGITPSTSITVFVKPYAAPGDPRNVYSDPAAKTNHQLTIRWENTSNDAECGSNIRSSLFLMIKRPNQTEYSIYKELPPNSTWAIIEELQQKEVIDFRVFGLSNQGLQSNWIGGRDTTLGPPYAPGFLSIAGQTDALNHSVFNVKWEDGSNDTEYFVIEYSTDSTNFVELGRIKKEYLSIIHYPISEGQKYFYRVKAGNKYGESAYTPISNGIVFDYTAVPVKPFGLTAKVAGGKAVLNWRDETDKEASFEIERSGDAGVTFSKIGMVAKNITTYTDESVISGKSYTYKVRAINPLGASDYSNTVDVLITAGSGLAKDFNFTIFPNPTLGYITVEVPENSDVKQFEIKILDQQNNVVLSKVSSKPTIEINFDKLKSGMYNIVVKSGSNSQSKKVMKY